MTRNFHVACKSGQARGEESKRVSVFHTYFEVLNKHTFTMEMPLGKAFMKELRISDDNNLKA